MDRFRILCKNTLLSKIVLVFSPNSCYNLLRRYDNMKTRRKQTIFALLFLTISLLCGCTADLTPTSTPEPTSAKETVSETESAFTVRFIDVGQADSALISCDGHHMLIDGGNRADSDLVYTVLKNENITHLDLVIGTHSDEDHIGGIAGALNFADADTILCPVTNHSSKAFENFKKYADMQGGGLRIPSIGESFDLGSADVDILAVNSGSGTNDTSIVTKITYGETTFLFTGDAESETEAFLLNSGEDLTVDVLKVSHHGSSSASSAEFLNAVMPDYSVISVGKGNSYGHPTEEVLERLEDIGTTILRTDLSGDIIFTSDGTSVSYTTEKRDTSSVEKISGSESMETYILNINTMKFHKPECKSAKRIHDTNKKEYSGTRNDVISMGYEACEICKP